MKTKPPIPENLRLSLGLLFCFSSFILQAQDEPLLQWAAALKATTGSPTASYGYGIDTDASGNVYSTGHFVGTIDMDPGAGIHNLTSTFANDEDMYISKLNADGTFAWGVSLSILIDNLETGFDALTADASGNVYITGEFTHIIDFDPGPGTLFLDGGSGRTFILKLDTDGNFVWAKLIASSGGRGSGRSIALDNAGNVIISGFYSGSNIDFDPGAGTFNMTSSGANDAYILKLDNDGNFIWARSFGSAGGEAAFAVAADNSNNVLASGVYSNTVDFDPGAGTFNMTAAGSGDIYILKLDNNGNFVWARSMGGSDADIASSMATDDAGNVVVTGYFSGTADFDPGAGTFNLSSKGFADSFIAKVDPSGNFGWATSIGDAQDDRGNAITIDASGNLVCTGFFYGSSDFDPGAGTFNMTSGIANVALRGDIYILKLDIDGNFIWAVQQGEVNHPDEGNAIATDADDNIYVTGSFTSTTDFDFGPCEVDLSTGFNPDKNAFVQKIGLGHTYIPTVTSVSPANGPAGITVTITGTDFSPVATDNVVVFGAVQATITANSSTSLTVTVPPKGAGGNAVSVRVTIGCAVSGPGNQFVYAAGSSPTITSFTPGSGPVTTSVTITGTNFSATPANNTVQFNGTTATATSSSATSITTTVPTGATTGKITVTVAGNTATSATDFTVTTVSLPTITSFTPSSGPVGNIVTITGTNFSTTPANNIVKFNGTTAAATASTTTSITTTVPTGASTGKITVTVAGNTATSATDFTVTTVGPTITINPQPHSTSACEGATATFTLSASGTTNLAYQWEKFNGTDFIDLANGGGYSGTLTPTLTINTAGSFGEGEYRCKVSGDLTPDVYSETVTLTVNPYPVADITVNGTELEASSGDSYQWYQNGVELSQATEQILTFNVLEYGGYTVDVTANGCTSTSGEFVYLITGTESGDEDVKIYPNPFTDYLFVELALTGRSEIKIIDALGQSVKTYFLHKDTTLQLGDLSMGTYMLVVQTGSKNFYYRLIKAK